LVSPPSNQRKLGKSQENALSHLRNQWDFSAARAQNPSGSAAASSIHRRTIGLITSMTGTSSGKARQNSITFGRGRSLTRTAAERVKTKASGERERSRLGWGRMRRRGIGMLATAHLFDDLNQGVIPALLPFSI